MMLFYLSLGWREHQLLIIIVLHQTRELQVCRLYSGESN
uniref:Uncharacterized protein n=1 Tax=Anguilla anguilla TaxID=7936 RepID=A0A0E9SXF1_ANGAN